MAPWIDYIPVLTTIFAVFFTREIARHYRARRKPYLFWWMVGVITFGLGTLAESVHAFAGWHEFNLKYWYIIGALLGGWPLAQGSVYLLLNRRFADVTTVLFGLLIAVAAVCVILTPVSLSPDFDGRLTGAVFTWTWVRSFSPFINIYAFIFLVGGAIYSAIRYYRAGQRQARFRGNIFIAIGGLLPGIGGTFTRMGYVEVLFITELVGLLMIYAGYRIIRTEKYAAPEPVR